MPDVTVNQWQPGEPKGPAATLPITRRYHRTTEGIALFTEP
jgi:hypothetical protein